MLALLAAELQAVGVDLVEDRRADDALQQAALGFQSAASVMSSSTIATPWVACSASLSGDRFSAGRPRLGWQWLISRPTTGRSVSRTAWACVWIWLASSGRACARPCRPGPHWSRPGSPQPPGCTGDIGRGYRRSAHHWRSRRRTLSIRFLQPVTSSSVRRTEANRHASRRDGRLVGKDGPQLTLGFVEDPRADPVVGVDHADQLGFHLERCAQGTGRRLSIVSARSAGSSWALVVRIASPLSITRLISSG